MAIKLTIWNEFVHERRDDAVKALYSDGIHKVIGRYLEKNPDIEITYATLDQPEHGLTDQVLDNTDVLIWWGHCKQYMVHDEIVEKVFDRVLRGMGLIALHSARGSKIFKKLMGTSCALRTRRASEKERLWVVDPSHPIAEGLDPYFELVHEEMFGEWFDIPTPDAVVFIGWYKGGEVLRSGCCFNRGNGKIFFFQPGHETDPSFHNENVLKVIENAVKWCRPAKMLDSLKAIPCEPLEPLNP